MDAKQIIEFIQNAPKKTPVKIYFNGDPAICCQIAKCMEISYLGTGKISVQSLILIPNLM